MVKPEEDYKDLISFIDGELLWYAVSAHCSSLTAKCVFSASKQCGDAGALDS